MIFIKNISSNKGECMKEKIERFARGEFDDYLPKVELPKNLFSGRWNRNLYLRDIFVFVQKTVFESEDMYFVLMAI